MIDSFMHSFMDAWGVFHNLRIVMFHAMKQFWVNNHILHTQSCLPGYQSNTAGMHSQQHTIEKNVKQAAACVEKQWWCKTVAEWCGKLG